MPIPRKILIRVIGAPLLIAALCGILAWGEGLKAQGRPNTPVRLLVLVVAVISMHEISAMCAARGVATARSAGMLAIAGYFFP